jgi:hypothetical protein
LLPSSSTEAATATVCRIAWNHDDTPGHEFRAEISFRSREDVLQEFDDVLSAVKERKDLKTQNFEGENERWEVIEEVTEIISKGISKLCAAWALDEADLEDTDQTLDSVP